MQMTPPSRRRASRTYPLSALFLLTGIGGVLGAFWGPAVRAVNAGTLGLFSFFLGVVLGTIILGTVGGIIGLFHYRRLRGLGWGVLIGGILGAFLAPALQASPTEARSLCLLAGTGTLMLLALAVGIRVARIRSPTRERPLEF